MKATLPTYSVFVSSSDSYSDIWDVFFDMFQKYWPEYSGNIYLQTENMEYHHDDLNIICTKVGKHPAFGATLRAGLDKVPDNNVLFIMIDYLFMGKVNHEKVTDLYQYFCKNNLVSLCLKDQNLPSYPCSDRQDVSRYMVSDHVFNYQIAFWRKELLKEMALPHENPWTSEWYGNKRALKAKLDIRTINENACDVFVYNAAGCLHRGKWMNDAIAFLKEHHYTIDFDKRGVYEDDYKTVQTKFSIKKTMFLHGIKGSYWHRIK